MNIIKFILFLLLLVVTSCRQNMIIFNKKNLTFYVVNKDKLFFNTIELYDSAKKNIDMDSLFNISNDTLMVYLEMEKFSEHYFLIGTSSAPQNLGYKYTYKVSVDSLLKGNRDEIVIAPLLRNP